MDTERSMRLPISIRYYIRRHEIVHPVSFQFNEEKSPLLPGKLSWWKISWSQRERERYTEKYGI